MRYTANMVSSLTPHSGRLTLRHTDTLPAGCVGSALNVIRSIKSSKAYHLVTLVLHMFE